MTFLLLLTFTTYLYRNNLSIYLSFKMLSKRVFERNKFLLICAAANPDRELILGCVKQTSTFRLFGTHMKRELVPFETLSQINDIFS